MSGLGQFDYLRIKLDDIKSATNDFAKDHRIGEEGFGPVFKGNLIHLNSHTDMAFRRLDRSLGQGDIEFWRQVMILSVYKHENIVSLLGFCDENDEKIIAYEHASNRSLDLHLNNKDLTWIQRLEICIGAAKGLEYFHNPRGTQQRILHRDIKSANILLDENWNAKIAGLGLSKYGPADQKFTFLFEDAVGTFGYCDPEYYETGLFTKKSDVYSLGVVFFEILCGRLCILNSERPKNFTNMVRSHYKRKKLDEIIWGHIKDEIDPISLKAFSSIAYQCLKRDHEKRPSMTEIVTELETSLKHQLTRNTNSSVMEMFHHLTISQELLKDATNIFDQENYIVDGGLEKSTRNMKSHVMELFQHLKLFLELIKDATNKFDEGNYIGEGGTAKVYRGEFGETMGAVKRLYCSHERASVLFLNEIMLLSSYRHENIISLIGFCDENDEKIIVYEYAYNKSLDQHLNNDELTWIRRLKIVLGAAYGLEYLHNPKGNQQAVLHRDIKSSNILLDENWNAKIADFGLSKCGPTDPKHEFLFSDVKGTLGYCDPEYLYTMVLTKKSDVYSFGVVLFEVLCSRLCIDYNYDDIRRSLPNLAKVCYENQTLDTIINANLRQQMEQNSFDIFISLAYECLERDKKQRPSMDLVVNKLQTALKYQEDFEVKSQEAKAQGGNTK